MRLQRQLLPLLGLAALRDSTTCRKKFTLYVSILDTCWDSSASSSLMRLAASSSRFAVVLELDDARRASWYP